MCWPGGVAGTIRRCAAQASKDLMMGPPHEKGHASQKPQTQQTSVRVRVLTSQCFDSRAMMRRRGASLGGLPSNKLNGGKYTRRLARPADL